ncbi:glutamate-cysteine ligase family protein [Pontibacter sp. E15-1]|uniref:carboxylate-amine ligase n=1 Tax=Pontibacter sp. E15-1 TaxID=2919918 RepID=UPI001F4F6A44|nr:glutamate-cysteine ligase family protein [Pontibacter sp. E15-1]MCJ8163630.1 glutamate-cysteine ligase family protein [Pontibacter sp. E15-1]
MTDQIKPLHLFEGYGVELEYMIVRRTDLQVLPITDKLIYDAVGAYLSDVSFGDIAWSNELVLHVVEMKTDGPAKSLHALAGAFQRHVRKINGMLEKYDAMLLPTGAHPLMDPYTDTRIWPHEYNAVYDAYNRIFDCRGHGWANLQSTHLNLPFANDDEFGRLHAAIRVLLPLIPALSASSPILDGKVTGFQDTRLEVYRHNQDKIPSIAGKVIPEAVFTQKNYEDSILKRIYIDVAAYDNEGILQDEFLNSRGAIARFSRNTIEIRLIDIQECPAADLAVLQAVVGVLKALVRGQWVATDHLKVFGEDLLAEVLLRVIRDGQEATLQDPGYLACFGLQGSGPKTAGEVWRHLITSTVTSGSDPELDATLHTLTTQGNLATRILAATGPHPTEERIREVYRRLAVCLQEGKIFL